MQTINQLIGQRIKQFRKNQHLSMEALGKLIYKSKATISKYESGEIAIDITTLYEIANVLKIDVEQLLIQIEEKDKQDDQIPAFFQNIKILYCYFYDGRSDKISLSILEIGAKIANNKYSAYFYLNIKDTNAYLHAEYAYKGVLEHYDIISNLILTNQQTPLEHTYISFISPFNDGTCKTAMMASISTRPVMPIASKLLFSKQPLVIDEQLKKQLLISEADLKLTKAYNMFTINQSD